MIRDLLIVPKHFFVPDVIEKRNPLKDTAKRAGWVGCNILLNKIPIQGRISVVSNGAYHNPKLVVEKMHYSNKFKVNDIESRGWLFDVMYCVNQIIGIEFSLTDVYKFEDYLSQKHPNNRNVKAKIRQQLQFLRDKGAIEFLGNGKYKKIWTRNIFFTQEKKLLPSPNGDEIDSFQVLGVGSGKTFNEALSNLLDNNSWITETGFDLEDIGFYQIAD